MNVSLTPELEEFINKKVASGMYVTASEVVREALRAFKNQDDYLEQRKAQLIAEIQVGLDEIERGEFTTFDANAVEDIKERGRPRLAKQNESSEKAA
jgi:antitoxin ParD1/3/4